MTMMLRLSLLLIAIVQYASAGCNCCPAGYSMRASGGTNVPNAGGDPMTCGKLSALACDRPASTDAGWNIVQKAVRWCDCRNSLGQKATPAPAKDDTSKCSTCTVTNSNHVPSWAQSDGVLKGMKCGVMAQAAKAGMFTNCARVQQLLARGCCTRRNLRGDDGAAAEEFQDELTAAELEALESSPEYREMMEAFQLLSEAELEAALALPIDP